MPSNKDVCLFWEMKRESDESWVVMLLRDGAINM